MGNDKTTAYIMAIVVIVAIVGAVYMISLPDAASSGITGNVVSDDSVGSGDFSSALRVLIGLGLVGAFVFMYHKF